MTNKILIIVESPSKCKTIQNILGANYKCVASKGHLMEINTRKFNINTWNLDDIHYKHITRQKKTIEILQKEINQSHDVILATDCDREGETIAWHICLLFHLNVNTTKRIRFQEITSTSILTAIRNPSIIHMDTVHAQKTRQLLDLAIGYTFSPLLWKYIGVYSKQSLSAGRCQTPALKLIYDHYLKERDYYDTTKSSSLSSSYLQYTVQTIFHINKTDHILGKLKTNIKDEKQLIDFLNESKIFQHKIVSCKTSQRENISKIPLITTSLQRLASKLLKLSPKQTMKSAQALYEKGYITYMRTDQAKYSDTFIDEITTYITHHYGDHYLKHNILSKNRQPEQIKKKDVKKTQDAHEAIRPTNIHITTVMTGNEKRLYQCIRIHTLQSCMLSPRFDCIHIDISAPLNLLYSCKREKMIFNGYYIVSNPSSLDNDNDNENDINSHDNLSKSYITYDELLKIYKDDNIYNNPLIRIETNAEPQFIEFKKRYNDSSLILELEKKGIGRPSTFTNIIDTLIKRKYVIKRNMDNLEITVQGFSLQNNNSEIICREKKLNVFQQFNRLCLTNLGYVVCKFLYDSHCHSLFEYEYTEKLENELDEIAKGEKDMNITVNNTYHFMKNHSMDKKDISKFEMDIDKHHQYSFLFMNTGECIRKKGTKDIYRIDTDKINTDTYLKQCFCFDGNNNDYNDLNPVHNQDNDHNIVIDIHRLLTNTPTKVHDENDITNNNDNRCVNNQSISVNDEKLQVHFDKMNPVYSNKFIGQHPKTGGKIYIRYGRYGYYLQYIHQKEKTSYSLESHNENVDTEEIIKKMIQDHDVSYTANFIENYSNWKSTISNRQLNTTNVNKDLNIMITKNASIRKSKYGRYLYYKTELMSKPSFLSLKKMKKDIDIDMNKITEENVCEFIPSIVEWIKMVYHVNI